MTYEYMHVSGRGKERERDDKCGIVACSGTNHGDEEPTIEDTSLTSLRRLKVLDVHEYVHSSLQTSYLRSLVQNRTVDG